LIGKVLGEGGSGSTSDIVDGLEWACDQHDADVVSMSLGSPVYSAALADEVEQCAESGTLVVIAAGNSRQNPAARFISSPADTVDGDQMSDGIVTVAATNVSAPSTAGSAYFSEVGPDSGNDGSNGQTAGALPTIGAPGMTIQAPVAASPGGSVSYSTLSGTSMATPLVSGAAAALISANESLRDNPGRLEQRLAAAANPMPGAGYTEVGAGMVSLENAVDESPDEDDVLDDQRSARSLDAQARDAANRGAGSSSILWRVARRDGEGS
jgi:subtilisin family serine protease